MSGYWIGKLAFGLSDADRRDSSESNTIIEWHMDLCTYIHHSVPYVLVYSLWKNEMSNKKMVCNAQYQYNSLFYSYVWLYIWFLFIYMPWRLYTKDCVYSILDCKQTPLHIILFFVAFIHFLIYAGNNIAFMDCLFYQAEPQASMYEL
jgi:heme/copper-type cytochrome/quinol oxidase subunit 2